MTQTTRYAAVLAKIGAERSRLLSENKVKGLAENRSLTELAAQLRDTPYQEQIGKISLPLSSRKFERAFNDNLIDLYAKIIKNSPKNARNYLNLRILRYELENIKVLINGTKAKFSPEQKLAKVYFSAEDYLKNRAVIEEAAKASGVAQLIHAFKGTEYISALNLGLKSYEEKGSTTLLEILIDKIYYEKLYAEFENLSKKEKRRALFYASLEADGFTLTSILRGKSLSFDSNWIRSTAPSNYFKVAKDKVEAIITAVDFDAALKIVLDTNYADYFVKAPTPQETVANAEKAFRRALLQHAKASVIRETFNIGAPLAFMMQKEVEVRNLTALSVGVEAAMKPEDIRNQLFF